MVVRNVVGGFINTETIRCFFKDFGHLFNGYSTIYYKVPGPAVEPCLGRGEINYNT